MKKFLVRSAIALALSVPVAAMSAQTAPRPADPDNGTVSTTTERHDDAGKWGLVGLLGLVGLMGLKRADRTDRAADNYRTNTATGVPTR